MKYRDDLKIEFKAEVYGRYHRLKYRISPDQDLTYYTKHSIFGFTLRIKHKYSTKWQYPNQYLNWPGACEYSTEPVLPVLCDRDEFEKWKNECPTIGEFYKRLNDIDENELKAWAKDRAEYLKEHIEW